MVWLSEGVPKEIIDGLGKDPDADYNGMMDFFCNRWKGRSGTLTGCAVHALPENGDAINVFNFLGGDFKNQSIESAIRMLKIEPVRETFEKVRILADKIMTEVNKNGKVD